ncbi:MAG TPA: pitrilysin family protein [Phycisphaerae bacterium]|nr:pitrilysin family protein [Phycisphaerae bacterium]
MKPFSPAAAPACAAAIFAALLSACTTQTTSDHAAAAPAPAARKQPATQRVTPATVSERIPKGPDRRVLKLSNGFTVILQQNKTAPVVAARIYVKAGSLTEQQYMGAGISHVVEHLVAGATSGKRGEEENTLLLEQIGNDSDAYTTNDHTCYFITTTAEKWPVALDLLVDWTTDADFTPAQFAREYQVVQRELEMDEAQADQTFYTHTASTRYLENPAGLPVIGFKPAFQKLTYEDAKAYYKEMYVPDNMIISIAGDIDLDDAQQRILKEVANIPRKKVPAIALPPEPQVMVPRVRVSHADVKEARVMWAFPTTSLFNDDLYATDVLANALGGGESSILVQKLRDQLGLVVQISCDNDTPRYASGTLEIAAILAPDQIPDAQKALLATLHDVAANGISPDSLQRAKAAARASMIFGDQTAEQQAIRNALDYLATGNIDFTQDYVHHLENVTADQVKAVAAKYLRPDHLLTTALLPLNAKDPLAVTATAAAQTQPASAIQRTVLPNGLTLLISRNPAAPVVSFQLYTLGGLLAETKDDNGVGAAMMALMTRSTQSRSHEQIADFLDLTGTTLSAQSGSNSFALSMQCLKEHAPDAFQLFTDIALHPKFTDDELNRIRSELLASIDEATEDWFGEAMKFTREAYYANSPYRLMPDGDLAYVTRMKAADAQTHYDHFFRDPQHTVLAISGDIDPAAASQWAQAFAAIPQQSVSLDKTSTPAPPHRVTRPTDKQSATIMFAFGPGSVVNSPDRYALTLLQTYLGGYQSASGAILFDTLRGKGLVYVVQASNIPGEDTGMFLIAALGQPQNTSQIIATIQQIIADTKAGKFSDQALAIAKDQAITGQRLSNQTIADKNAARALDELLGLGYQEEDRFAQNINNVTRADLLRVANQYLANPTIVITTPEAK